jgi:hypothetical protein
MMAVKDSPPEVAAEEDLTDEQVEQLLARATARLQQNAKERAITAGRQEQGWSFNFPKLDVGKLEKPYLQTRGEVSSVDARKLLDDRDRKLGNGVRKVEDPVTVKKAMQEVSPPSNTEHMFI